MKTLAEIRKNQHDTIVASKEAVKNRRESLGYESLGAYPKSQLEQAVNFHDIEIEFIDRKQFGADISLRSQSLLKSVGAAEYIKTKAPELLAVLKNSQLADSGIFEEVTQKGIYVNVKLSDKYLFETLSSVITLGPRYGMSDVYRGQSMAIDYSSPNVAKHLHAGHIRSTIIGHVISNIYEAAGYTVHRINYLNDWGGFGFLLEGYARWKDEFPSDMPKNALLYNIYKRYREMEKQVVEEERSSAEMGRDYENFIKASRDRFNRLEAGEPDEVELWEQMVGWSLEEFNEFYSLLGISQDYVIGESYYAPKGDALVEEALANGTAEIHEGAASVVLGDEERLVIRRSDDSTIYATRDLAGIKDRADIFDASVLSYVVGEEQTDYFSKLFRAAKKLKLIDEDTETKHLSFGLYINADTKKKLSSREGATNVIHLLQLAEAHFRGAYHKRLEFSEAEKEANSKLLAIGSIAFNDVKKDRRFPVEFPENPLQIVKDFEEAGGAYVMYTAARARSIIRKTGGELPEISSVIPDSLHPLEVLLIKRVNEFPEMILRAVETDNPAVVAGYALELARDYNSYYEACAVMEAGELKYPYRLIITQSVAQVLDNALTLCHARGPERI